MTLVVLLIVAGIIASFYTLLFFVALFERHPFGEFVPSDWDSLTDPSKYFLAVNESARSLGFEYVGAFKQSRKSGAYGAYLTFWVAPDRKTLLRVEGGKTLRVPQKKMLLTSYLTDNRLIETTDYHATRDLSGLTDRKLLLHADLEELYGCHQNRLVSQTLQPRLWVKESAREVAESLWAMKANRLHDLGLARFINPERTIWCYSWRGALEIVTSLQKSNNEALAQKERSKLKRPGDV